MKPNDIIEVFEDPITRKNSEGKAKLLKCLNSDMELRDGRQLEYWEVEYLDDGFTTGRVIG